MLGLKFSIKSVTTEVMGLFVMLADFDLIYTRTVNCHVYVCGLEYATKINPTIMTILCNRYHWSRIVTKQFPHHNIEI